MLSICKRGRSGFDSLDWVSVRLVVFALILVGKVVKGDFEGIVSPWAAFWLRAHGDGLEAYLLV